MNYSSYFCREAKDSPYHRLGTAAAFRSRGMRWLLLSFKADITAGIDLNGYNVFFARAVPAPESDPEVVPEPAQ